MLYFFIICYYIKCSAIFEHFQEGNIFSSGLYFVRIEGGGGGGSCGERGGGRGVQVFSQANHNMAVSSVSRRCF
jgi:hypothetical protein